MLTRILHSKVEDQLRSFPAVALLGARQVGKTTLARSVTAAYGRQVVHLDLESPGDAAKLRDAQAYLEGVSDKLVVIDEVQRMPELFPVLRSLIDRDRRKGRFLLLGSSSEVIIRQAAESLAGRTAYLELFPFHVFETGMDQCDRLWLRGGFPEAFLARSHAEAFNWMGHYMRNVVERDLSLLGLNAPARNLRALLTMLSSVHGQPLNMSMLGKSLGLSVTTIKRYLDHFEQAYLIFNLPSFHTNTRKRLTRTPKTYLLDSGMLHALNDLHSMDALRGHALVGNSWEGFVIQQVRSWLNDPGRIHYFRTMDGSELDLVITRGNKAVAALEIKTTNSPSLSKGNQLAFDAVGAKKRLIVTPSADDHPYGDGITVCSLPTLWQHLEGV
ncbi:MAG: ATP-binding protein [Flavobacteriales bacterium]|nr:ATP-binding protein [Flavobacteriales bacterium]